MRRGWLAHELRLVLKRLVTGLQPNPSLFKQQRTERVARAEEAIR